MGSAEFDSFADEYHDLHQANVAISGEPPEYFADYKVRALATVATGYGVQARRLLDFGSGIGNSIPAFGRCFPSAELTCADVSQRSLDLAASRSSKSISTLWIGGETLPLEDQAFDLAFSACVFHHVAHEKHVGWLRELRRVTRPGGLLMIFEHNPLNPLTVHAVNTCPFDVNAKLIRSGRLAQLCRFAGWVRPRTRFHLFFPRFLAALRPLERGLSRVPFGAQYSVVAERSC